MERRKVILNNVWGNCTCFCISHAVVGCRDTFWSACHYNSRFTVSQTYILLHRRKSRSVSPRRRRSRSHSPTPRRRRSHSRTPRRHKRQRSRSVSPSPIHKSSSPSIGSIERKNAHEKMRKEEEEKKRYVS